MIQVVKNKHAHYLVYRYDTNKSSCKSRATLGVKRNRNGKGGCYSGWEMGIRRINEKNIFTKWIRDYPFLEEMRSTCILIVWERNILYLRLDFLEAEPAWKRDLGSWIYWICI